jgi:LysM repeat protein
VFSKTTVIFTLCSVGGVVFMILSGCNASPTPAQPMASSDAVLTPFQSPTPSETHLVPLSAVATPTNLPTPTPTPIVYTIVKGDTMLGIALRNGISLEELQAANPEVNPRLLSVGTDLIIPLGEIIPSSPMTATPIPVDIAGTECYLVPDGSSCFTLVNNERGRDLENLTARVLLYDDSGGIIAEGTAISALNKLPAGAKLPLVIFFSGSFPGDIRANASILSAQLVPKNDGRYLNAWLEVEEIELAEESLQAKIIGTYGLPKKSRPGRIIWIVGVAYDGSGNVVGLRKIEQFSPLEPGMNQEFTIEVYSMGPNIAEIEAFIEIMP